MVAPITFKAIIGGRSEAELVVSAENLAKQHWMSRWQTKLAVLRWMITALGN